MVTEELGLVFNVSYCMVLYKVLKLVLKANGMPVTLSFFIIEDFDCLKKLSATRSISLMLKFSEREVLILAVWDR